MLDTSIFLTLIVVVGMAVFAMWLHKGLFSLAAWGVSAYALYYGIARATPQWSIMVLIVLSAFFLLSLIAMIKDLINGDWF